MANYLALVLGKIKEIAGISTSAGAADAGKVAVLGSDGRWDNSLMPIGIGSATKIIVAFEALAAGDFVNVFLDAGTIKVRKADANSNAKMAHGYVQAAVASAGNATVYYGDLNTAQTGLTQGSVHYLSAATPGKATTTLPTGTGKIIQQLGVATSATELLVEIQQEVELA